MSNSFIKKCLVSVSAIALLSACAVGPDYERPALPIAQSYEAVPQAKTTDVADGNGGAEQTFATGAEISATWWTLFHSDELNKMIDAAFQANPDLEAAEANLRVAGENYAAAIGYLFPTVSGSFSSEREKTSPATAGGIFKGQQFNLHSATLDVSYGLDVFGATRRVMEEDEAQEEYQQFQLEAARLSLSSNIVANAVQEASLRDQIAETEDIIKGYEQQVDILKKQADYGAIAESTVLSEIAALEQARANLPALDKQLGYTRHALSALMGQTPDKEPPVIAALDKLTLPKQVPVTVPAQLVEQRPDVRAAEANLKAASAAIGVAIANRLPGITLTGSIGSQANKLGDLFTPGLGLWSMAANASQTIFDFGTLLHRQRSVEAEFDVARAQYRSTVLAAFQDVSNVLRALRTDAAALKAQDAALKAAADSLKLTKQQFEGGSVSFITLLDAQRVLSQAKLQRVQAEAQRYTDTATLFQALGGGWWNRSPMQKDEDAKHPSLITMQP